MPPTESQILTSFLLPPAPLPQIITLKRFTSLFPHALQSHPQIAHLYHELQHLRALDTDQVIENIAAEVRRGDRQRREVARARRRLTETGRDLGLGQGDENDGREIRMEMECISDPDDAGAHSSLAP
ncbi:MAG: hypothetical protein M1819_002185 [Sarea resinae]|nr:MAG: hypothetical protein M1819_002185 [Sarea resinae]